MATKVPPAVIEAALRGRLVIPVGYKGKFWRAFPRPTHLSFTGDVDIELKSPSGEYFILNYSKLHPEIRPIIIKGEAIND